MSVRAAWALVIALCLIGLAVLLQLDRTAQIVALASLALVAAYPFMKRITWWPQAWLGLVFSWGALVGWPAVTGSLDVPALWLYVGTVAWVIGYDTLYAIQDVEDDALVGVKSSARALGDSAPLGIAIFYALAIGGWEHGIVVNAARPAGAGGIDSGGGSSRRPGIPRRPQGWRRRACPVPLEPDLRLARLRRHAGGRHEPLTKRRQRLRRRPC